MSSETGYRMIRLSLAVSTLIMLMYIAYQLSQILGLLQGAMLWPR
jgi:hypothetical protein